MKLGKRWSIALLLVVAVSLPLRFAQAAQNWCPWMQAPMGSAAMMVDMPECEGMSKADGHCSLKAICAAVPVLNEPPTVGVFSLVVDLHFPAYAALNSLNSPPPERVPIA